MAQESRTGTNGLLSDLSKFPAGLVLALQAFLFFVAGVTAFLLRFDFGVPARYVPDMRFALCVWVGIKVATFASLRLHRALWRYVSSYDLARLLLGNLLGSVASGATILWLLPAGFPRSIHFIDLLVCFLLTAGLRLAGKIATDLSRMYLSGKNEKRTLIYGAGDAGVSLLREVRQNPGLLYSAVGFIDDNVGKKGLHIQGLGVLGDRASLPYLVQRYAVDIVLIAVPSATAAEMREILAACRRAKVAFKTMPGIAEVIEEKSLARQLRDVAVEDILGRVPVKLDHEGIRSTLRDQVVLVTGAAGSIGSELCRQIARFRPAAIVGLDISETGLFFMERQMRDIAPDVRFVPEIGSIQNARRLGEVLRRYSPSLIYHAAAYKHVPMMEQHAFEAVENNIFGTLEVASAALRHGVREFVMISSDKAVRPTNVMGVTKRVAELVIVSLGGGPTKFASVRFGNVLGSSGSVVPIFKEQIAVGGPVTVTHPEMCRYFMTIPEAAQLVLQASAFSRGGEIFVLDMGEPIRILDLARNLIQLSGLRPDEDIKIEFTGVRPGEKLFEELNTRDENLLPTRHEKVRIFVGTNPARQDIEQWMAKLRATCQDRGLGQLIALLREAVPDYSPSPEILRRISEDQAKKSSVAAASG